MMSTPATDGKTRPSVKVVLYLALSAAGGVFSGAGKEAWDAAWSWWNTM
ncbi:hypothetical protein ACIGN6_31765 [Streptomyces sp. NPDC053792]